MGEKYVVSLNSSGITNRIKSILSGLRISQWLSRTPLIYWPSTAKARCEFSDLYKNTIGVIRSERELREIYRNKEWTLCRDANRRLLRTQRDYILLRTWRLLPLPEEVPAGFAREVPSALGNDIDFEFHRIPVQVQEAYAPLVQNLVPVDYVAEQVEAFSSQLDDNTVSVGVRSWVESEQRRQLFDVTEYFAALDAMRDAKFFMSCDNPNTIGQFANRYGERVLFYPKRTSMGDRGTIAGMQDILIDLYLLSKNKTLVAPAFSTFPEMAWWLGGCKADVRVVGFKQEYAERMRSRDRQVRRAILLQNLCYKRYLKFKAMLAE